MKIPTFSYFFDLSYYLTPCNAIEGNNSILEKVSFDQYRNTANLLAASMAAKPSLPCTCEALVGFETESYHATAHIVRLGRRSTD